MALGKEEGGDEGEGEGEGGEASEDADMGDGASTALFGIDTATTTTTTTATKPSIEEKVDAEVEEAQQQPFEGYLSSSFDEALPPTVDDATHSFSRSLLTTKSDGDADEREKRGHGEDLSRDGLVVAELNGREEGCERDDNQNLDGIQIRLSSTHPISTSSSPASSPVQTRRTNSSSTLSRLQPQLQPQPLLQQRLSSFSTSMLTSGIRTSGSESEVLQRLHRSGGNTANSSLLSLVPPTSPSSSRSSSLSSLSEEFRRQEQMRLQNEWNRSYREDGLDNWKFDRNNSSGYSTSDSDGHDSQHNNNHNLYSITDHHHQKQSNDTIHVSSNSLSNSSSYNLYNLYNEDNNNDNDNSSHDNNTNHNNHNTNTNNDYQNNNNSSTFSLADQYLYNGNNSNYNLYSLYGDESNSNDIKDKDNSQGNMIESSAVTSSSIRLSTSGDRIRDELKEREATMLLSQHLSNRNKEGDIEFTVDLEMCSAEENPEVDQEPLELNGAQGGVSDSGDHSRPSLNDNVIELQEYDLRSFHGIISLLLAPFRKVFFSSDNTFLLHLLNKL